MPERPAQRLGLGLLVAIAVVAFNAFYVSAYTGFVHGPDAVSETDHLRYIEMAKGAENTPRRGLAYEPPYCYRVLTPALAGALARAGLDLDVAFYAITQVGLVGFLFCLYRLLSTYGLGVRERVLGLVLVGGMQGAVRWYAYQYWMTDPLALFAITLAMFWIRTERLGALFALSIVGVAARETYLVVFPYLLLHTWRTRGAQVAVERTLALALAPVALLIWIRFSSDALPEADLLRKLRFYSRWRAERLFDNQLYLCTIGSFGVLLPLALLYPRRALESLRRHAEAWAVVAAVYASLGVGNNTDRLLAYAVPALLPAALANLHTLVASTRVPFAAVAAAALAAQAVLYRRTVFWGWHAASVSQPFDAIAASAIVAFWVLAAAAAYGLPRAAPASGGGVRPDG